MIDNEDDIHKNHPMLRETFSFIVNDLDAGLDVIKGIFEGY